MATGGSAVLPHPDHRSRAGWHVRTSKYRVLVVVRTSLLECSQFRPCLVFYSGPFLPFRLGTGCGRTLLVPFLSSSRQSLPAENVNGMLRGEDATLFVKHVFDRVFADLSPRSVEAARAYFSPTYTHEADGKILGLNDFLCMMQVQKARLATAPKFSWKNIVATESHEGRVAVTSVHSVALDLKNGPTCYQQVIALIHIDEWTGKIAHCDELTMMHSSPPPNFSPAEPVIRHGQRAMHKDLPPDLSGDHRTSIAEPSKRTEHKSYDSTMTTFEAEFAAMEVPEATVPSLPRPSTPRPNTPRPSPHWKLPSTVPPFSCESLNGRAECAPKDVSTRPLPNSWLRSETQGACGGVAAGAVLRKSSSGGGSACSTAKGRAQGRVPRSNANGVDVSMGGFSPVETA